MKRTKQYKTDEQRDAEKVSESHNISINSLWWKRFVEYKVEFLLGMEWINKSCDEQCDWSRLVECHSGFNEERAGDCCPCNDDKTGRLNVDQVAQLKMAGVKNIVYNSMPLTECVTDVYDTVAWCLMFSKKTDL